MTTLCARSLMNYSNVRSTSDNKQRNVINNGEKGRLGGNGGVAEVEVGGEGKNHVDT